MQAESRGQYFDGKRSQAFAVELWTGGGLLHIRGLTYFPEYQLVSPDRFALQSVSSSTLHVYLLDAAGLRRGDFVVVENPYFIKTLQALAKTSASRVDRTEAYFMSSGVRILGLAAAFIGLVLGLYFLALPPAASALAGTLPYAWEQEAGLLMSNQLMESLEIDSAATEQVRALIDSLPFTGEYDKQVYVVNEDELNAFAIPGGTVVIFSGLYNKMTTPSQRVALLGHEFGHVEHRHSIRSLARDLAGYLFVSVLFGDMSGLMVVLAENAHLLNSLSYSRSMETQADDYAWDFAERNGYDPSGLIELFELMQEEEELELGNLQFLSTHPAMNERIERLKNKR